MRSLSVVLAAFCALMALASSAEAAEVKFKKHVINAESKFEAAAIFDIDGEGTLDIFCGSHWYEGPNWERHFVREVKEQGGYYHDFANLPLDVDGDGYTDIVSCAWHSKALWWVRHPGADADENSKIEEFIIDTPGNMETALLVDVNNDGKMDVLPNIMSAAAWYETKKDPSAKHGVKWVKHDLPKEAAGHGIGAGDINGDGRTDIVSHKGWLEQVNDAEKPWVWRPEFDLGHASIPCLVHDVDGDGDGDIIWGLGHDYGVFWLEQGKGADGKRTWTKHVIDDPSNEKTRWSQPHFMLLADLDLDGQQELVTGKRVFAHNGKDPGGKEPPVLYYYDFDRATRKWTRVTIDDSAQVGFGINCNAADLDGDGDIDLVAPGKSGLYGFENLLK